MVMLAQNHSKPVDRLAGLGMTAIDSEGAGGNIETAKPHAARR